MGTYSKGALVITREALAIEELIKQSIPKLLGDFTRKSIKDNLVMFSFESRKMYAGYDDVSTFHDWLDSLNEECYKYIEVCEDHDEHIIKGELLNMWPETYIVFYGEIVV